MRPAAVIFLLSAVFCFCAVGQPLQDPLLDRMVGAWILTGTIAGQSTTHDIVADWILDRQYVRLHEVSREKKADGRPAYEAIVIIGKDPASDGYACLWLDSTSNRGLSGVIAHARPAGDRIEFLFNTKPAVFHTTFVYNKSNNSWKWLMDGEENGKLEPFARVELTAK